MAERNNIKELHDNVKEMIQINIGKDTFIEITNVVVNNDGFNNFIAVFNLSYSNEDVNFSKKVVYKDYSKKRQKLCNEKYNKEIGIFKDLKNNKYVNVPKIYFTDDKKLIVIMEHINGTTIDKIHYNDIEKYTYMIEKFAKTLANIHMHDYSLIQNVVNPNNENIDDHFYDYINYLRTRIIGYNALEYLDILDNIVDKFHNVSFGKACLNHGDYHFWNILVTDDDKLFCLDWEKAKIADLRYDIAYVLVLGYSWFGIDFKKQLLDAYKIVTGKDIVDLDCFMALLSLDIFSCNIELIQGCNKSIIRDKSYLWVKRRYELFVEFNGIRIADVERFLENNGLLLD